ncbi:hypothetical protein [Actinacidiphila acidipaludis]|uniref:2'-5' RNA ligase n=1 Tax=Actinacidiphila acidipaludis TaxID=2873382 RepID=A0ABS7Q3B6_9ACTN|nr:hypothetical protein [Streptomyces acidipaludis]MBY8877656.1 hypothetical protein [Streptomyces acidipaludis]
MKRGRPGPSSRSAAERALVSVDSGIPAQTRHAQHGQQGNHEPSGQQEPEQPATRLWHVTLSVSGPMAPLPEVRRGLEQLAHDHPFLLTSRYAGDHAEIRYWEEARDLHDAAALALRLWGEHRSTAGLPPWETVGLEVIDRETYHQRLAEGYGPAPAVPVGVHPF